MSRPRDPRSGSRPAAASTASSAPWARAARSRAWPRRCSRAASRSAWPIPRGRRCAFYTEGRLDSPGSSITEGIGQGRITANLEGFRPDYSWRIPDAEALPIVFDLLTEEGLCLGGSSGINIAGAIRMARELGPGHTIVTILCDYGNRYQSKLFNPAFLKEKGLPVPEWLDRAPRVLPTVFEDA
jgi:cysteine synthase A